MLSLSSIYWRAIDRDSSCDTPSVYALGGDGMHFSLSRTSRPVWCRSTTAAVACHEFIRVRPRVLRSTARRYKRYGIGSLLSVRPVASTDGYWPSDLVRHRCRLELLATVFSNRLYYRSAMLLLWVLSGPVLKHGPRSLACARVIGKYKT